MDENTETVAKVVAAVVTDIGKELVRFFAEKCDQGGKELEIRFNTAFTAYLTNALRLYGKVKTLLYHDTPVDLHKFYVNLDIMFHKERLRVVAVQDLLNKNQRVVLSGAAGCGKSTLMRHLFVTTFSEVKYIPIYFELRNMNDADYGLLDALYQRITVLGFSLEQKYFMKAIELGKFVFYLDGFDEVSSQKKSAVSKDILALSDKYHDCAVVVTSRPDESFVSWGSFTEGKVLPLDKEKACELIEKLDYDEIIKNKFLSKLRANLFVTHRHFLSNPLLLSIMLLTYDQFAEIPNKMHIFYSQAFDTLYSRHDAQKGAYKREFASNLSIDDFKQIVACLATLAYFDKKGAFTKDELRLYLGNAAKIIQARFVVEDLILDLVNSVCILREDGLEFTFVHRTFQEYFVAVYISQSSKKVALLGKLIGMHTQLVDRVIGILLELDRDLVESEYVIPKLKELQEMSGFNKIDPSRYYFEYCKHFCRETVVFPGQLHWGGLMNYTLSAFLSNLYMLYAGTPNFHSDDSSAWKSFIEKFANTTDPRLGKGVRFTCSDTELIWEYSLVNSSDKRTFSYWIQRAPEIIAQYEKRSDSITKLLLS